MTSWETLQQECLSCKKCPLWETRTNVVFGTGDPKSPLLFVGEAPGATEDATGQPFTGRAGKLLDAMLASVGMDRSEVYIANTVKCRPPQNRDPLPEEQEACLHWLEQQVQLIQPRLVVCLGRISAMRFIRPDFRISEEHGRWFQKEHYRIMAIFHPAALLRDPGKRGDTFADLQQIERAYREIKGAQGQ